MKSRSSRSTRAVLAVALLGMLLMALPAAATAKKHHQKGGTLTGSATPNATVPLETAGPPSREGIASSTITLDGRKAKGRRISDLSVTGLTASASGPSASVGTLSFRLTAPDGITVDLIGELSGTSIGPLTLTDHTPIFLEGAPPSVVQDPQALSAPYVGTAEAAGSFSALRGGPAKGAYTLTVRSIETNLGRRDMLISWGLAVKTVK